MRNEDLYHYAECDDEDLLPSWEQAQADAAGVPLFGPI